MSNNCSKCKHWVFGYNQTDESDVKYNTRGECCIRSVDDNNFPERDMDECCGEFEPKEDGPVVFEGWWGSEDPPSTDTPAGHDPVFYQGVKAAEAGSSFGRALNQIWKLLYAMREPVIDLDEAIKGVVETMKEKEQSSNTEDPTKQDKEHCNCAVCCEVRGWQNE